MKMKAFILSLAIAAIALVSSPALAGEGMGMHDKATMEKHGAMGQEMMGMFKDVMVMLKDLDHKPSPEQKQRLADMIKRMDDMMKEHEGMMKKGMDTTGK